MKATDQPVSGDSEAELEICLSCLQTNAPGTHFCRHCYTPLTSWAATAPFESIFAQGDFLRKAILSRRWNRLIRVLVLLYMILMTFGFLLGFMLPR